jgi:hypothetical protein
VAKTSHSETSRTFACRSLCGSRSHPAEARLSLAAVRCGFAEQLEHLALLSNGMLSRSLGRLEVVHLSVGAPARISGTHGVVERRYAPAGAAR